MNGFSFLEPGFPLQMERALAFARAHSIALIAACACITLCSGTWAVERVRLHQALALQASYQVRFDLSKRELEARSVSFQRMLDVIAIDREIRHIADSGRTDARRITEVANAIPEHAWLTSVIRTADHMQIEGRARDLSAVSRVMRNLSNERGLANPALKTAALMDERAGRQIRYELDVETP